MRQMLTATKVSALSRKPDNSTSADGGGLYFRKRKNSASWVIRRTRNKVASFATIGRFPEMNLAEARRELRKFGSQSVENLTVADLLDDWFAQNERLWKRPEQMEGYIRRLTADDPHIVAKNIHSGAVLAQDVEWKDSIFTAGSSVIGGQDFTLLRVFFGRSFDTSDRHDFGVGAGFHWLEIGAYIEGNAILGDGASSFHRESVSVTGPLPNIGA